MATYPIVPSFAGGVACEALWARTDLEKYNTFLKQATNVMVMPHGGVKSRPGTKYCGQTVANTRLIPFEFSTTQAYVLEFYGGSSSGYMYVWKDGGQVLDGGVEVKIVTPYSADDIADIRFCQSADVLYLVHPDYAPRKLSRTSHTDWTLETIDFDPPPMGDLNDDDNAFVLSGTEVTGRKGETVTLTAEEDTFTSADVGRWIRIDWTRYESIIDSNSYSVPDAGFTSDAWEVDGEFEFKYKFSSTENPSADRILQFSLDGGTTWLSYTSIDVTSTWTTLSGELTRENDDGDWPQVRIYIEANNNVSTIYWNLKNVESDRHGYLKITGYTSATVVTCEVQQDIMVIEDGRACQSWYLDAFNDTDGYPSVVKFYQDRLVFASTSDQPQRFWMSETSDYESFDWESDELEDSDCVDYTIASGDVNSVQSIVSLESMLLLTTNGSWRIAPSDDNSAITPASILVRPQGSRGASSLQPLVVGSSTLFVQRYQSRVRELAYSLEQDAYDGPDLSVLSADLFEGHTITAWAYQQEPWGIIWAIRDDGKLLSFTYLKEHEVTAWALHETDGEFLDVVSISGDTQDEVYFLVKRTIDGATAYYVEMLGHRWHDDTVDVTNGYCVDCGITYDSTATTTPYSGALTWLEDEDVAIVADGYYYADKTVASGTVTLDSDASLVHIGLPFTCTMQTMEVDSPTQQGTSMGRKKRVARAKIRVRNSLNLDIGPDEDKLVNLKNMALPAVGAPTELYSGYIDQALSGGYGDGGSVILKQSKPYPMEVLAILPVMDNA